LPAFPHGFSKDLLPAMHLTFLFNLLHFPAGAVPITTVRASETKYVSRHSDNMTRLAQEVCEGSEGLPVGIQVATLPFADEV
jgi:Asp-tRNA(Asn)/Glu-tRNA(Gln) amidotransferase A subunit family amidase